MRKIILLSLLILIISSLANFSPVFACCCPEGCVYYRCDGSAKPPDECYRDCCCPTPPWRIGDYCYGMLSGSGCGGSGGMCLCACEGNGGPVPSEKPRCALVSTTPDVALGNTLDITTFIDSPDECFWEVRDDYCTVTKFGIGTQRTYEELDGTDACGYIERVGFIAGQVYGDFCNGNICDRNGCDSNCGSSWWACRTYLYRFHPGTQPGRCKVNLRVCNDDGTGECSIVINVLSQPCGPCIPSGCGHSAFFIDERFAKEGKEIAISSEPASCGENKVLAETQDRKSEPTMLSVNAFEPKPEQKGFFARTEIFLANILEQVKSFFGIVFKSVKELTLAK